MKNDKSWRGMLLKDNDGDWGVAVAAWRGMKKGQPGVPGIYPVFSSTKSFLESLMNFKLYSVFKLSN